MIHGMSQFHSLLLSTFFSDISAYTMSLSSFSSFLFSLFFFLFFSPPTQTIVKKISRTCVHVSLPITRPMKRSYRGRYRSLSFSLISLRTDYVDTSFILVATFAAIIEELTSRGLNIPVIVLNRSTEESPRAASAVSERGRKSNRERERERERERISSGGADAKDPPRIQRAARNVHRASVRNASVSLSRTLRRLLAVCQRDVYFLLALSFRVSSRESTVCFKRRMFVTFLAARN